MFRYATNVRLASFLALTCSLRLSLALSGSYWISPCLSLALYGSLWLPLWLSLALTATLWHTLALFGSLLLSNFAYTALDWLTGPLLGSDCRCHDDALSPALINRWSRGGGNEFRRVDKQCRSRNIDKVWNVVAEYYSVSKGLGVKCTPRVWNPPDGPSCGAATRLVLDWWDAGRPDWCFY